MRLLRKHPDTFSIGSFLPAIFYIGVALGWTLGYLSPILWWTYWGVLTLYVGAIAGESLRIAIAARNPRLFPLLLLILPAIHLASATGVIMEIIRGKK
jgi:hypothetical protein